MCVSVYGAVDPQTNHIDANMMPLIQVTRLSVCVCSSSVSVCVSVHGAQWTLRPTTLMPT